MKLALFSVSYGGLWGQHRLDLEAFIVKAAELGYPAVELMAKRPHLSILDWDEGGLARLRRHAANHGVEIATLAGYTDFTSGQQAAEVPFVEMQVAYVRALAHRARQLGAKIIRVFTGYSTDPEAYQGDWEKCVRAIRECSAVAADYGVMVGVQNHHDTAISCDAYIEFLDDVDHPNCRAMFDPWSPALNGEDLYTYAKILAPRMAQTTIADYVRLKRFAYMPGLVNYRSLPEMVRAVPVGEGFIDMESFFAYEMCSPVRGGGGEENLDRTARQSLQKIQQLIG
jgi:sugar phosphate isomerase/epimerase